MCGWDLEGPARPATRSASAKALRPCIPSIGVRITSASRPRLHLLGLQAVAGIGEARESRSDLEGTCHPHRIEGALHVETLVDLDVDDLVGRRRWNVNACTDERYQ